MGFTAQYTRLREKRCCPSEAFELQSIFPTHSNGQGIFSSDDIRDYTKRQEGSLLL